MIRFLIAALALAAPTLAGAQSRINARQIDVTGAGRLDTVLATKVDSVAIAGKADTTTVNAALATKADASATTTALAAKADTTLALAQAPNIPLERLDATIDFAGTSDGTSKLSAALAGAVASYPGQCVYQAANTAIRLDAAALIPAGACFIMGPGATLKRTSAGTGSRMVRIATGARVEGLTLDGGNSGTAVSGIVNEDAGTVVLKSITIRNMSGKAIAVSGAVDWTIDGLDVSRNTVALQSVTFYNTADTGFARVTLRNVRSDRRTLSDGTATLAGSMVYGASAVQINGTAAHPTLVNISGADFREPDAPTNAYQALGTVNAYGNISNVTIQGGSIGISLSKPTSDNLNVTQVSGRGQNLKVIEVPGDCNNGGCASTSDLGGGYINLANINGDGAGPDGVVRLPRVIAVDTTGAGINISNVVCRRYIQDCVSAFNGKNSLNIANVYADGSYQTASFAPGSGQGAVNIAASSGQAGSKWVNIVNVQCHMGGVGTRCLFFRNAQYVNARNVISEGLATGGKIAEIVAAGSGQTADFYDLDLSDGGNSPTSAMVALSTSASGTLGSSIRIRGRGFAPFSAGWTCDLLDANAGLGRCDATATPEGALDGAPGSRAVNRSTGTEYVKTTAKGTLTGWSAVLDKATIGLGSVDNTPDTGKPVSTAQAAAIALKADLAFVTSALSTLTAAQLASDYATSSATLAAPSGFTLAVKANTTYQVYGTFVWQSASTTVGAGFAFNIPGTPTFFVSQCRMSTTQAAGGAPTFSHRRTPNQMNASAAVDTANADMLAICEATFRTPTAGLLDGRIASSTAGTTVTLRAGSAIRLTELP